MKPFLIITSSDLKYGDFLFSHWLKSLKDNIDSKKVDIVVLDYGLSVSQKNNLQSENVKVVKCVRDGHVVNIRYRDMLSFLKSKKYKQVLSCDSGDIIFQANLMPVFYDFPNKFRAIQEKLKDPFFIKMQLEKGSLSKLIHDKVILKLRNSPSINGGFIIAPQKKFMNLCDFVYKNTEDVSRFGSDQFIADYYLSQQNYGCLDETFNFIPMMSGQKTNVKNGVFVDKNNAPFVVVHNTGGKDLLRVIDNFGYGKEFNNVNKLKYFIRRVYIKIVNSKIIAFLLNL
jgi:hypothetical protein